MSVFDKLLDSIKLNDDDYDEDNYLDEDLSLIHISEPTRH